MSLVINDDNLQLDDVQEFSSKVRGILINDENQVLVCNYGGVYLFPGGSIDEGETIIEALIRELSEEIGQDYKNDGLQYLNCLDYFQENYPKRNGRFQNRLVRTYYFVGKYKGISKEYQELTQKEKKDNFKLELISLNQLENIVLENINNNPRNVYFQNEILAILKFYNSLNDSKYKDIKVRTLSK